MTVAGPGDRVFFGLKGYWRGFMDVLSDLSEGTIMRSHRQWIRGGTGERLCEVSQGNEWEILLPTGKISDQVSREAARPRREAEKWSAPVVESAYRLHVEAGPGLLESVYEVALARMLTTGTSRLRGFA
jgi:hypothetical protein